ncbi:MAG: endolytic transglycosylase MltG [Muribaculaceae bacterium]|nr:endolytic transglycosylase MltG [Muribaculaceae bacterium]
MKKKIILLAACVVVCLASWLGSYFLVGASVSGVVHLRAGSDLNTLCDSLGTVDATLARRVTTLMRLTGGDVSHRQGAFKIAKGQSAFAVMRHLRSGAADGVRFTFNNVRTTGEWAARWGAKFMAGEEAMKQALADERLCDSLGFTPQSIAAMLLPDSYEFYWDITPAEMLGKMKGYYDQFWNENRRGAAQALGLTPVDVSIIASIVEEETAKTDERGKVARLYLNRLAAGMPLQADPTVKFALGDFSIKRLTAAMTRTESAYNTYRRTGLPPGPIRLPEKATLDAVLKAPQHNYLYMCAKEDFSGYHNFAVDYASHQVNARRYQAALDARNIH